MSSNPETEPRHNRVMREVQSLKVDDIVKVGVDIHYVNHIEEDPVLIEMYRVSLTSHEDDTYHSLVLWYSTQRVSTLEVPREQ